jgi:hypothetical protein
VKEQIFITTMILDMVSDDCSFDHAILLACRAERLLAQLLQATPFPARGVIEPITSIFVPA